MRFKFNIKLDSYKARLRQTSSNPAPRWYLIIAVLFTGSVLLAVAVHAYNYELARRVSPPPSLHQEAGKPGRDLHRRLSFQPDADRLRTRLGQRFIASGRARTSTDCTLGVAGQQYQVRIVRSENEEGEHVEILLGGTSAPLTWNGRDGAKSANKAASGLERTLIERLALDSPDQFVLAQVRGASYYTIARDVRPQEAGSAEDYAGPVWDLVRVAELAQKGSQSQWRVYYINSATRLIDKVLSQDQGETIVAEFSGWTRRGSELMPGQIRWSRNGRVEMELVLNNFTLALEQ